MSLPMCSGMWFCHDCHHENIFRSEYKRSNRRRGVKIIRCFPHCCPSHVERSYCGSPLLLAVNLGQSLAGVHDQALLVIARFEAKNSRHSLTVGSQHSLHDVLNMNHSSAPWIHGRLQPPTDASTSYNTRIFRINDVASTKWYYHWRSGANKTQRLTKHVLNAYILCRLKMTEDWTISEVQDHSESVQVLGVAYSPAFTIVSHRRSLPVELISQVSTSNVDVTDSNLHDVVRRRVSLAFQSYQTSRLQSRGLRSSSMNDKSPENKRRDCHGDTLLQAPLKDLSIIFLFVPSVSFSDAIPSFCVREHVLASIHEHSNSSSHSKVAALVISAVLALQEPAQHYRPALSSFLDELLIILLKLVVWMIGDANINWMRRFFDEHAKAVTNKARLRVVFQLWLEGIMAHIDAFWLQTGVDSVDRSTPRANSVTRLQDLSDCIVRLIDRENRFSTLRPPMREILENPSTLTTWFWQPFVAQLRETYLRKQVRQSVSVCTSRVAGGVAGEWELDATSFSICQPHDALTRTPSVWNVLILAARLARWRVAVRDYDALLMQCEKSLLPVEDAWMSLICDNTIRTTSVLPLGLVSLVGSRDMLCGDAHTWHGRFGFVDLQRLSISRGVP